MDNLSACFHPESTVNLTDANELTVCLICGSNPCTPQNTINYYTNNTDDFTSSAVSSQLNVIFILKHLLQVPTSSLQTYLVKLGNPSNWQISLCEQCNQLVNQAKDLHFEILGISTKLKKIRKEIVDKAKIQLNDQSLSSPDNHLDILLTDNLVLKETRQFIKSNNYDDHFRSDPILEGNQLIKKIFDEAALSTELKIEVDQFEDNLDDSHDDNWLPSPQPVEDEEEPPNFTPKKCHLCPSNFEGTLDLFGHLQNSHYTNQLPCLYPNCPKILTGPAEYLTHERWHSKPLKCDKCSAAFKDVRCFRTHMLKSHQIRVSKKEAESIKSKSIKITAQVSQHQRKRKLLKLKAEKKEEKNQDKPLDCDKCEFKASGVTALFHHLEESHPMDRSGLRCPFEISCPMILRSASQWYSHKAGVHDKIMTTCHLCGELLSHRSLDRHLARKHLNSFLKCNVSGCDGRFLKKERLEMHKKKKHGGGGGEGDDGVGESEGVKVRERYFCSFCAKGFSQRRHMLRHELLHRNKETKPFICEICGKRFATEAYVQDHIKYKHWGTMIKKKKMEDVKSRKKKGEEEPPPST